MLLLFTIFLLFATKWFPVENNTIPAGVRVRWNITSHKMEYTFELLDGKTSNVQSKNLNIVPDIEKYSVDDLLKHYFKATDQLFLKLSKQELKSYIGSSDFIENMTYNSSDASIGIVMANSEIIDLIISNIEKSEHQSLFHSIVQNNHFAQTKIHERFPYLISHLSQLKVTKTSARMLSSYIRGHTEVSQTFYDRVGLKWILDNIEKYPEFSRQLQCLGYDLGQSLNNKVIYSMFHC
eukprot:NODE_417_length_7834_cov_0.489334.p4 type:complete len:237 gc:universal NODE_417_length_7834_cov_0.489334:4997-4287(-)